MNARVKKIVTAIVITCVLVIASYGVYRAYHFIIQDAITRIRTGVKKGLGGSFLKILNPFSWGRK